MDRFQRRNPIIMGHFEQIIPVVHFLLSFLWEGKIFIYEKNGEYSTLMVRDDSVISDKAETMLLYILCRIFCFVIIWYLWKLIFVIAKRKISVADTVILGTVLVAGLVIGLFLFPDIFGIEVDNYTNYLHVRRGEATYWQSIYTGALYGGCFMVLPHPIALFIFQWLFFWFTVSYIYIGIERTCSKKWMRFIPLAIFLLPESYYLAFNAYRNNYYTVLVVFYVSYLYFHTMQKDYKPSAMDMAWFSLLSAFIMTWRSEGALIGAGGFAIYTFFLIPGEGLKQSIKKTAVLFVCTMMMFAVMHKVQGIGNEKYYGQDYMILNTTRVLYSVLNDPAANLNYEEAEEDLNAIEKIVPVELLKERGMSGFRSYNWASGRRSFNQTLASDEDADAYMSAYYRIILHNKRDFINVQLNSFCESLRLPIQFETYSFTGEKKIKLEKYSYSKWEDGRREVLSTWKTTEWNEFAMRARISEVINKCITRWDDMLSLSNINPCIHIMALLMDAVLAIVLLIRRIAKKGSSGEWGFILAFAVILAETAAIFLFMPEGRAAYMYPMLYASYVMFIFLCAYHYSTEHKSR